MPLHDLGCPACEWTGERLLRLGADPPLCPSCGHRTARLISLPAKIAPELTPYHDDGLGVHITSRAQRRALMKANGLVEHGGTRLHGAKGTIFSHPGRATVSVAPNGAYARHG
jgi:putative FmdB family regulatory protein